MIVLCILRLILAFVPLGQRSVGELNVIKQFGPGNMPRPREPNVLQYKIWKKCLPLNNPPSTEKREQGLLNIIDAVNFAGSLLNFAAFTPQWRRN